MKAYLGEINIQICRLCVKLMTPIMGVDLIQSVEGLNRGRSPQKEGILGFRLELQNCNSFLGFWSTDLSCRFWTCQFPQSHKPIPLFVSCQLKKRQAFKEVKLVLFRSLIEDCNQESLYLTQALPHPIGSGSLQNSHMRSLSFFTGIAP